MRPHATHTLIAVSIGLAYLVIWLYLMGDISLARHAIWQARFAPDPGALWLKSRSLLQFEAIAMLQAGRLVLLFSPLNAGIAILLGLLITLNTHGMLTLRKQPVGACRTGTGNTGGMVASLPPLLAGGACCAPALLILVGIPALGAFAGLIAWLLPVSLALLAVSRWWQHRQGAPHLRVGPLRL